MYAIIVESADYGIKKIIGPFEFQDVAYDYFEKMEKDADEMIYIVGLTPPLVV